MVVVVVVALRVPARRADGGHDDQDDDDDLAACHLRVLAVVATISIICILLARPLEFVRTIGVESDDDQRKVAKTFQMQTQIGY